MTGTLVVLVVTLVLHLVVKLLALVATFVLAKCSGQHVKSMSWTPVHGYTAEFFPPEGEPQSGNN
jgi:hypothetical protein